MPEISEFDQEFTTEGSAGVETEKLEALIQQNLSPEEQNFMESDIVLENTCSICFEDFNNDENIQMQKIVTDCKHCFSYDYR